MAKKKVTVEFLKASLNDWNDHILESVKYRDKIAEYMHEISENNFGTTPPGVPPKNPPGVPRRVSK